MFVYSSMNTIVSDVGYSLAAGTGLATSGRYFYGRGLDIT